MLSEKRAEYRVRPGIAFKLIEENAYGSFIPLKSGELKRVLSNLINNAVEAIDGDGEVVVSVQGKNDFVQVSISDNGKGISEEILPRLMQRGATFNKPQGSGLGLAHAKEVISSMGGSIRVESRVAKGTSIYLSVPSIKPPSWFLSEIQVSRGAHVVVIDDDSGIHQVWDQRFDHAFKDIGSVTLMHLHTPDQLRAFVREKLHIGGEILYLCDFEFSRWNVTGLDLIEELGIEAASILVTSRFEETGIIERCERLRIKVLPKALAVNVPIKAILSRES